MQRGLLGQRGALQARISARSPQLMPGELEWQRGRERQVRSEQGPECKSLQTVGKIGFILGEMGVIAFFNL